MLVHVTELMLVILSEYLLVCYWDLVTVYLSEIMSESTMVVLLVSLLDWSKAYLLAPSMDYLMVN